MNESDVGNASNDRGEGERRGDGSQPDTEIVVPDRRAGEIEAGKIGIGSGGKIRPAKGA